MEKLLVFAQNTDENIKYGIVRAGFHLTSIIKENSRHFLLLTPPLPADHAYQLLDQLAHRKKQIYWWLLHLQNRLLSRSLLVSEHEKVLPDCEYVEDIVDLVTGRIVTQKRAIHTLRKEGYWPASIYLALDQAVYEGKIEQFAGIRTSIWGEKRCARCNSSQVMMRPCSSCGRINCPICLECLPMGEIRGCTILLAALPPKLRSTQAGNADYKLDFPLTLAQERASEHLMDFCKSPKQKTLVWAACGAGKTEITYPAISRTLKEGQEVLFAIPRQDIVRELAERIGRDFSGVELAVHYGGQPWQAPGNLVLATTHQALHFYKRFALVILDEVDAYPYQGNDMLRFAIQRAAKDNGKIIEMSATPNPLPREGEAITIPARHHGFPLPEPELCKVDLPDLAMKQLDSLPQHIFAPLLSSANEPWLIFVPTIAIGNALLEPISKILSMDLEFCYAQHPNRKQIISRFRHGKLATILATSVLERGVTFPGVQVMVLYADHPLFSRSSLVQIAGRVGRRTESPQGQVLFCAKRVNNSMRQAVTMIRYLNKKARCEGLLRSEVSD